ncbi:MAG: hypothetical protein WAW85_14895 [Gordonia sp. (in: high G+C Gram-positive bacteria)]
MASHHVAPSRVCVGDLTPVRLHLGRVLALVGILVGVLAMILVLLASAA